MRRCSILHKNQTSKVCAFENLAILQERIEKSFEELPMEMVNNAIDSYKRRLVRCINEKGKSVECR
jgi:hypothetical protein